MKMFLGFLFCALFATLPASAQNIGWYESAGITITAASNAFPLTPANYVTPLVDECSFWLDLTNSTNQPITIYGTGSAKVKGHLGYRGLGQPIDINYAPNPAASWSLPAEFGAHVTFSTNPVAIGSAWSGSSTFTVLYDPMPLLNPIPANGSPWAGTMPILSSTAFSAVITGLSATQLLLDRTLVCSGGTITLHEMYVFSGY